MKALIEKQILEWEQEIIKQNAYVLKLEGGVHAYRLLLQKVNIEGILIRNCPVCGSTFKTMEQRRIYCRNACKTKACRSKSYH